MIAHKIKREGTDRYKRLALYVLDVSRDADPRVLDTPAFNRLVDYISDRPSEKERVVGARITNCGSDRLSDAIREIDATQAMNKRSKSDKGYHLVFSFPEGERPSLEQLRDIEDHLVRSIGLGEHQRISAIHDDTDNLHVHVAINKIHPTTFRNVTPFMDAHKLMVACIELEQKHGLLLDFHGREAERQTGRNLDPDHAASQERQTGTPELQAEPGRRRDEEKGGRESFERWLTTEARGEMVLAAGRAATWAELHDELSKQGVVIRPRGAGLVISARDGRAHAKASSVDPSLSFGKLTERLGPYVAPDVTLSASEPMRSYQGAPRHDRDASKQLFERYRKDHARAKELRQTSLDRVAVQNAKKTAQLKAFYAGRSQALRSDKRVKGPAKKQRWQALVDERTVAFRELRAAAAKDRAAIRAEAPLPTWQGFLEREASGGNGIALRALRSLYVNRTPLGADILTAVDRSAAKDVIYQNLSPVVGHDGSVRYSLEDGGRVTDRRDLVQANQVTVGSAFLALSLAAERFSGQALQVSGTEAFRASLVEVSALRGFDITFADPAMERARLDAVALTKASPAKARPREKVRDAAGYVQERNETRFRATGIAPHRLWAPEDAGVGSFAGLRRFGDGGEAVLIKRGDVMLVLPVTQNQAAKASRWSLERPIVTDNRGRFVSPERHAPKMS